jgi:antitoxin MazE
MKLQLVRIGNSRGIRIPKPVLEQCRLRDAVELQVEEDRLVILPGRRLREGWEEAFRAAGPPYDDELLIGGLPASDFDQAEWKW